MDICIIVSVFLLHLFSIFPEEVLGMAGPMCDPVAYPMPYVKVLKKRNGPPIDSLDRSGFIDLTKYIHRILCINGPAVLYSNMTAVTGSTTDKIFTNGVVGVHTHECIIINQIATDKAIELRDAGKDNPTMNDVSDADIIGVKATGIYLVSEKDDFYLPTSVMFRQRNWDYLVTSDDSVSSGSFVTVGKGPFCITVNDQFDIVLEAKDIGEDMVCKWTLNDATATEQFKKRYDKIFNGTIQRQNFTWRECAGGGGDGGLGPFPQGLNITNDTAMDHIKYDPFSIIDPKFWSARGSNPLLALSAAGDGADGTGARSNFNRGNKTNIKNGTDGGGGGEEEMDDTEDFLIDIDKNMCIKLPPKVTTKPADCTDVDEHAGCDILDKAAMSVDEPPVAPTDDKDLIDDLEWKKEIIEVSAEIFGKICEPFAPEMPFTIGRIIEYYLARAHKANSAYRREKLDVWDFLISELRRCNQGIKKPILWYWDNKDEVISPDPVGPMHCKAKACGDYCSLSEDEKFCQPTDPKICEDDFVQCTNDTNSTGGGASGSMCVFVNDENPSCRSRADTTAPCEVMEVPGCSNPTCMYNETTFKCDTKICPVSECTDPACVIKGNTCEDPSGTADSGGANPSGSGSGSGGGGPGGGSASPAPSPGPTPTPPPATFIKPHNQEVFRPKTARNYDFNGYPVNVLVITNIIKKAMEGRTIRTETDQNATVLGECLFYYEDMAETDYELNIAIDIHWKIWATVIGYCNNYYQLRKSETFPRLYNTYYEDFFQPIVEDWKYPKENNDLRFILSEFNSEKSQKWLDVCLESSYYVSNSSTFRPPRPLTIGNDAARQSNYFLQIPDFIAAKFHQIDISNPNETVKCP